MTMAIHHHMLLAWGALALAMAALWLVAWRRRNAGIVDVAWAFGTAVAALWLIAADTAVVGVRGWLIGALMAVWGARLGSHLWRRVTAEPEDGRYRHMRESLGAKAQPVLFGFFQIQALWGLMFALPAWAAARSAAPALGVYDAVGVAVWLAGQAGEIVADRQLARFRADPRNRGAVCDTGLWRYSRHPNYFFEWLHWVGFAIVAVPSPYWWVAALGVGVMYVFLTRITGVPHTEAQALRSRGAAYERYQRTTSAFFPLPPDRVPEESST